MSIYSKLRGTVKFMAHQVLADELYLLRSDAESSRRFAEEGYSEALTKAYHIRSKLGADSWDQAGARIDDLLESEGIAKHATNQSKELEKLNRAVEKSRYRLRQLYESLGVDQDFFANWENAIQLVSTMRESLQETITELSLTRVENARLASKLDQVETDLRKLTLEHEATHTRIAAHCDTLSDLSANWAEAPANSPSVTAWHEGQSRAFYTIAAELRLGRAASWPLPPPRETDQ